MNIINRMTVSIFVVLFVLLSLLTTVVYSIGVTAGYEGSPAWSWHKYGEVLGGLFVDIPSLLALLGGVAILVATAALAGWLAHHQHTAWAVCWFLIGVFGGGFVLYRLVNWSTFGFGFGPVIALAAFTAVTEAIVLYLARALGNNHNN